MPIVGFGTWQLEGSAARDATSTALQTGYRHLDTATVHRNEREVGQALAASGLDRDEVFVTTKLPGNVAGVRATIEKSLIELGIDYVDLWLIHWPPTRSYDSANSSSCALYEEMLALRNEGLARAIGVSNYGPEEIDELITATGESPEVNQIPWSPFLHDAELVHQLDVRGVVLEGYSPFNTSRLDHPILVAAAAAHGVTPAQIVLRWHVLHGIVVIPKSVSPERIRENLDVFGFSLDAATMQRLDGLASI